MNHIVRIALITGYLGAGKTTVLNAILANNRGIRAAVIVNDIGEINIDSELIARDGIVTPEDNSLIPLTNGCICCTLKEDLSAQLRSLAKTGDFDYIIIEASGICEPLPIAHTINAICEESAGHGISMKLDNIIAVVDCARMFEEFRGGRALTDGSADEDDIEHLLILQIEFCNTILLNKTDLVTDTQREELTAIIRSLQKEAVILPTVCGAAPLEDLLYTDRFDLERSLASAAWLSAIHESEDRHTPEGHDEHRHDEHHHDEHHHDEHHHDGHHHDGHHHDEHHHDGHHHDGHHHDGHSHIEEFGISTFVYDRRRPFLRSALAELTAEWPQTVIRCKGMVWYQEDPGMSYIFEQSGRQIQDKQSGPFLAAAPRLQQEMVLRRFPEVQRNWDPVYGDRRTRLVFIGKDMDQDAIEAALDRCLGDLPAESCDDIDE